MMDELKDVKRALSPTEVLLVVDAMTGQEAAGIHYLFEAELKWFENFILVLLDGLYLRSAEPSFCVPCPYKFT